MKVNPANSPAVQTTDLKGADNAKKSERVKKPGYDSTPASTKTENNSSSAEISSKAKDMAQARQLAKDSPDVREQKIAELREKIQNKTYKVAASDIADKLVDDHIRMAGA